jgi:glycosyltransferase involved in cell wall biosynthesis
MTGVGPLAFYVPSLTVGGAERVTVTVANGLADRGYDVELLVPYCEGAFADEVSDPVEVVDLETKQVPFLGIGASVPRLARYLRRNDPEMLFSQMTYANDVCLFTHLLTGSDAVTVPTVHNTYGMQEEPKERFVEVLARGLSSQADQIVAVSEGVAESVVEHLGVERHRVSVLHNPIPVEEVHERGQNGVDHPWLDNPEQDVVLGVGRLERQKNFRTFLEAFQRVHEERPTTRAIVVGRGSKREELDALAHRIGIADAVSFAGYVDNPYGYMASASVLAMSSIHEGLPTVLIEALACGCPVVSTDCPSGPREILQGGTYGPLVPVGDAEALASGIQSILDAPPAASDLRSRAADFSPESVLEEYEAFVEEHGPATGVETRTVTH